MYLVWQKLGAWGDSDLMMLTDSIFVAEQVCDWLTYYMNEPGEDSWDHFISHQEVR